MHTRSINYDHSANLHTVNGAIEGLAALDSLISYRSVLDVGTGTGTWLAAAQRKGLQDVAGVDGVSPVGRSVAVNPDLIAVKDLRLPFDLGRQFDLVLCLEVAEHVEEIHAPTLIASLCRHSDTIFFSAAAPFQLGDNHVNCQWPSYWQGLFNELGFACDDAVRWQIWDNEKIEPWYRQNAFLARRDRLHCGRDPRLRSVVHPRMFEHMDSTSSPAAVRLDRLVRGDGPLRGYFSALNIALLGRLRRWFARTGLAIRSDR